MQLQEEIGHHFNTKRPNAFHMCENKRIGNLEMNQIIFGRQIAYKVSKFVSSPALNSICIATELLLTSFDLKNENDFKLIFASIDAFTDWLRNQSRIESQFKTLKPAFQKYLSECGLAQLKSHRTRTKNKHKVF